MVAMLDGSQPKAVVAATEAAARLALPAAPETMPIVRRTEGAVAEGPPDTTVVVEETDRELSLVLTLGDSHPPMRKEPLLLWGSPQDPSLELFTLDDDAEGMERWNDDDGSLER